MPVTATKRLSTVQETSTSGINHHESGMVNLPLGSTAGLRIVGAVAEDSGWVKRLVIQGAINTDSGGFPNVTRSANFYTAPLQEEIDGANSTSVDSVRISLLWRPADHLTIQPTGMWQLTQQNAPNAVDINGDPTNPAVPSVQAHWEPYDTPEPQRDRLTLGSLKLEAQLDGFSIASATGSWNRGILISQDGSEENSSAFTPGGPYDPPKGIGPAGPEPQAPAVVEDELRLIGSLEGDYVGNRTDAPYGETITLLNIKWTATAFVNNVFNKEALLDPQPQINLQTTAFARYLVNQPVTGGMDLLYRFR